MSQPTKPTEGGGTVTHEERGSTVNIYTEERATADGGCRTAIMLLVSDGKLQTKTEISRAVAKKMCNGLDQILDD